ncbi:Protein of unknown function DUF863 [Macleaya cordata]|uniref:Uncharacterized protein n=1 Tax=Macleaya cordata TaxID=56857 RepID=A0A200QN87_MACCD|nr:Protein of unknown function DUF863 [Macleaya cordata]
MGTKVQCESYYPGYYPMRDLNEDASSSSWSLYHEDKTLNNGNYYNSFLPRPTTDGYPEYNKEVLKQTMLQHEAIFRKQVFELHRVYRIQMELMDEVKRKERGKYLLPVEASQSSPFSSHMQSEDAQKTWHIPSLPSADSAGSRASASGTDNMQPILEFIKVSGMQASPVPMQNGGSLKDSELLESKSKPPRRMFDLQLPADEYIDSEEGEPIQKGKVSEVSAVASYPLKRNCGLPPESDVNLSLGSSAKPSSRGDTSNSASCLRNLHNLADLNEPIQVEDIAASVPVNFLSPVTCQREIQGQDLLSKPNSSFLGLPREFFQNSQKVKDSGAHVNVIHLENGENRREWLSCNFDAGQCSSKLKSFPQGFCTEKLRSPSELIQVDLTRAHAPPEYVLQNHNSREPLSVSAICGTEISKRSQSLSLRSPSESIQVDLTRAHAPPEYVLHNHNSRDSLSVSAICGTEISKRSQSLSNHNFSGHVVPPCTPIPYPVIPQYDVTDSGSPSVSSWRMPMSSFSQKQTVQALSHFDTSAQLSYKSSSQSPGLIADKWHLNCNLKLKSNVGNEPSYQNGFHHWSQSEPNTSQVHFPSVGFDFLKYRGDSNSASERSENQYSTKYFKGSDCRNLKSSKDMNLNLSPPHVSQQDVVIIDGEEENEDPPGELLALRPVCNNKPPKENGCLNKRGLSFLQGYCQEVAHKVKKEDDPISSYTQDFTSVSYSRISEPKRIEVGECSSSKKILGFSIFDKPLPKDPSSLTLPLRDPSELEEAQNRVKIRLFDINMSQDPAVPDSVQQHCREDLVVEKGHDKDIPVSRNYINLNSSADEEEEALSTNSLRRTNMKIAAEIDLETPVVPETAESISSGLESLGSRSGLESVENQVRPVHLSKTLTPETPDELVRVAAEAIIIMSSSVKCNQSDNVSCQPLEESMWDPLHWFAGVVSANMANLDSEAVVLTAKDDDKNEDSFTDEIDYFESMTLKLTETKADEYWCSKPSWAFDDPNEEEEEKCASLLVTRRRRGQARRGRQRRDFQRDILPGLASLSRHEVTEDLQTFGGLMRATGYSWQTGMARRSSARNGCARGRRRSEGLSSVVTVMAISPPREQPNNSEQGLEERSLKGWGKTTRRPRRQRFAAGNPPIPLTQV